MANFDFNNWGSWGITGDASDLYADSGKELEDALNSGEDFDTDWHGFKKELESMRVSRKNGRIIVEVYAETDSIYEDSALIFDCVTDEEAERITEEMIDAIREELNWTDYREGSEEMEWLPTDASLDDIMRSAREMIDICNQELHDSFLMCMDATLTILYNYPTDRSFIVERLNAAR